MTKNELTNMAINESCLLNGSQGYVIRKSVSSWCLVDRTNFYRNRWGTAEEILQDIKYFQEYKTLPQPKLYLA